MFNVKTPTPHADAPAQGQCYPTPGLVSGANGPTGLAGPATVTLEQALAGLRAACDRTDILCQRLAIVNAAITGKHPGLSDMPASAPEAKGLLDEIGYVLMALHLRLSDLDEQTMTLNRIL